MTERVFVVGMGASTAVGRGAWESAAAVRAGISGFSEHAYMLDSAGEPMRVACAPWLDVDFEGLDRMEALLLPAVGQAVAGLAPGLPRLRCATVLALPGARPGLPDAMASQLKHRLGAAHPTWCASLGVLEAGHAGGLLGMAAAFERLSQGVLDACLVAAVDSWLDPETLQWLEDCDQLHGAGAGNNAWGFIPGEGGAALLLVNEPTLLAMGGDPLARVLGAGAAQEPNCIKTETVCIGEGLTAAFRDALAALPDGHLVSDIYCDMNGEPYRADEFGFSALRTKEHFRAVSDFVAPADCWGDVAAAGGLLHVMLACVAGAKGYANGPLAFAWGSSEMGERAALLLAVKDRGG